MQGVTILTSEYVSSFPFIFWDIILLLGGLFLLYFGIVIFKDTDEKIDGLGSGIVISGGIAAIILSIVLFIGNNNNLNDYIKYGGTIDKSVSYVEFIEKYELIEKKDNLYIFKDKYNENKLP